MLNSFCTFLPPEKLIARNALRNYIVKFNFQIEFLYFVGVCFFFFSIYVLVAIRLPYNTKQKHRYVERTKIRLQKQEKKKHSQHKEGKRRRRSRKKIDLRSFHSPFKRKRRRNDSKVNCKVIDRMNSRLNVSKKKRPRTHISNIFVVAARSGLPGVLCDPK